ncbi:hypothetical protein ACQP3L_38810, partial [Escherichia coli]
QSVGSLTRYCVAVSSDLKHFYPWWKLVKTQFQSSKGRLIQESKEVTETDEEYRVPPFQGYISSKDC